MVVWVIPMENIDSQTCEPEVFYVHGSGLFGVPRDRMNDIPKLRAEFHANEARRANVLSMLAWARRAC